MIRIVQRQALLRTSKVVTRQPYHTGSQHRPAAWTPTESNLLEAALKHVPKYGFSTEALRLGAQDAGHPIISASHFANGPLALVKYHLVRQRLALSDRFQRPALPIEDYGPPKDIMERVQTITLSRLLANEPLIVHYQSALALLIQPYNLTAGLKELARLADEILYLAGATAVTSAWYTDRAGLASIYASTELYMTQDQSPGFVDTKDFLSRRLHEANQMRSGGDMIGQWVSMQMGSLWNGMRSKGIRI